MDVAYGDQYDMMSACMWFAVAPEIEFEMVSSLRWDRLSEMSTFHA